MKELLMGLSTRKKHDFSNVCCSSKNFVPQQSFHLFFSPTSRFSTPTLSSVLRLKRTGLDCPLASQNKTVRLWREVIYHQLLRMLQMFQTHKNMHCFLKKKQSIASSKSFVFIVTFFKKCHFAVTSLALCSALC